MSRKLSEHYSCIFISFFSQNLRYRYRYQYSYLYQFFLRYRYRYLYRYRKKNCIGTFQTGTCQGRLILGVSQGGWEESSFRNLLSGALSALLDLVLRLWTPKVSAQPSLKPRMSSFDCYLGWVWVRVQGCTSRGGEGSYQNS